MGAGKGFVKPNRDERWSGSPGLLVVTETSKDRHSKVSPGGGKSDGGGEAECWEEEEVGRSC